MHCDECGKAYRRGHYAGSRGRWPEHRPPHPPVEQIAEFMEAAQRLRDRIDSELAKFGPDDEIEIELAPFIEAFDKERIRLSQWIKEQPAPSEVHP